MSIFEDEFNHGSLTNVNTRSLFEQIREYISQSKGSIYLIVPFITNSTLVKLLRDVEGNRVCIVTSWRGDHLKSGVSSLELYELCKSKGWTLFVNSNLHCKIYSDSFESCIITSANCTENALINTDGNIESCILLSKLKVGNRIELNKIVYDSTRIDDRIFEQYYKWFNNLPDNKEEKTPEPIITDISPFYVSQLPAIRNPETLWKYVLDPESFEKDINEIEHDLAIYSTNPFGFKKREDFYEDLRNRFLSHPFIKSLEEEIPVSGIRFGAFKIKVQNNCCDVPLPFRKDLTVMTQNLYQWFVELFPDVFYWDVPGSHSQVLHRRK